MRFSLTCKSPLASVWATLTTALGWLWNSTSGKVWYRDFRADKYVFWAFSWFVWTGFMGRFGFNVLSYVTLGLHKLALIAHPLACAIAATMQISPKPPRLTFATTPSFSYTPIGSTWAANPGKDLDLSVNTDCEDLAAFASDVLEFVEQDRSLLVDSFTDFSAAAAFTLGSLGVHRVLSSRLLKRR